MSALEGAFEVLFVIGLHRIFCKYRQFLYLKPNILAIFLFCLNIINIVYIHVYEQHIWYI